MPEQNYSLKPRIDQAIEKYSGGNEKYAETLKDQVSGFLGYNNFANKLNSLEGKDLEMATPVKGMTPSGIREQMSGAINLRETEQNHLLNMMRSTKNAASNITSEQQKKLAANKYANLAEFKPENWVERELQGYLKNPLKKDGTFETLDELKQRLRGQAIGEGDLAEGIEGQKIDELIDAKIPDDIRGEMQGMYYLSMGFSEAQANKLLLHDRLAKGQVTEGEMKLYEVTDPTIAKKAQLLNQTPQLTDDLFVYEEDGVLVNRSGLMYRELERKYPNVPPAELKDIAKPSYERLAMDDIEQTFAQEAGTYLSDKLIPPLPDLAMVESLKEQGVEDKDIAEILKKNQQEAQATFEPMSFREYMELDEVKNLTTEMQEMYSGILTSQELRNMFFDTYLNLTRKQQ